jgi:hypothetical protein
MTHETIPSNHVVALVSDPEAGSAVAMDLEDLDMEKPIIVTGGPVGERLEASSGFVMRVLQRLSNHLSEETDYLDQYEEAVHDGQTVVAVRAENDDEVRLATAVLRKHGAQNIRRFGRPAVTGLTPDSNPSAASGEQPAPRQIEHS